MDGDGSLASQQVVDVGSEDVSVVWVLLVAIGVAMTAAVWFLAIIWILRILTQRFKLRLCMPFHSLFSHWNQQDETWQVVVGSEMRAVSARSSLCSGIQWIAIDNEEVWNRSWDGRDDMNCCVMTDAVSVQCGSQTLSVVSEFLRGENGIIQPILLLSLDAKEVRSGIAIIEMIITDRMWYFYTYGSIAAVLFLISLLIEISSGLHPMAAAFLGGMMSVCSFFCAVSGYSWLLWSIKRDSGWPDVEMLIGETFGRGGGEREGRQRKVKQQRESEKSAINNSSNNNNEMNDFNNSNNNLHNLDDDYEDELDLLEGGGGNDDRPQYSTPY